jgi:hypothetical protein
LIVARYIFILLDRGSLIRVLDWPQSSLVFHLFRCSCLRRLPMTSLLTTEGMFTVSSEETPCLFLCQCQFISFLISCYSMMSRYPYRSDFIGFTQFFYGLRTVPCQSRFGGGFYRWWLLLPPCYQSKYVFSSLRSLARVVLYTSGLPSLQLETL